MTPRKKKRNLDTRNQEIREIYRYLRYTERRERGYCMDIISANYHIGEHMVDKVLAEPDLPEPIACPSIIYRTFFPDKP